MPSWRAHPTTGRQVPAPSSSVELPCSISLCQLSFADWLICWPALTHAFTFSQSLSLSLLPSLPASLFLCLTHSRSLSLSHSRTHTRSELSMHTHYRVTFNSVCWSENSLVSLLIYIVWVYRCRVRETCFMLWGGKCHVLKWVVFTALGCTRCFCTSDRLSQRLRLFSFLSFCVLDVFFLAEIKTKICGELWWFWCS